MRHETPDLDDLLEREVITHEEYEVALGIHGRQTQITFWLGWWGEIEELDREPTTSP